MKPYPGAVYHVVNRGHRREEIFRDDACRRDQTAPSVAELFAVEDQRGWRRG